MARPQLKNETRKGPWFIVDMTNRWNGSEIQRGDKPTRIYPVFGDAVKRSQLLAKKYPNHHWAVFECIGYAVLEKKIKKDLLCEPIAVAA